MGILSLITAISMFVSVGFCTHYYNLAALNRPLVEGRWGVHQRYEDSDEDSEGSAGESFETEEHSKMD